MLSALGQPPLSSHLDKSWAAHATAKAGLYEAQALLESGNAFHAEDNIASEIARLRVRSLQCGSPLGTVPISTSPPRSRACGSGFRSSEELHVVSLSRKLS